MGISAMRARMASSLVTKFEESVEKLPMREAIRYTAIKNGKWTATELKVRIFCLISHTFFFETKK